MNLQQAEQLAKAKMQEFFHAYADEVKSVSERMVIYSEKNGNDWVVYLGLLPRDAQSFEKFKAFPDMDDSEEKRARDWLRVIVRSSSGETEIEELNKFKELV